MALLTPEQKKSFGSLINLAGYVLAVAFCIALACKYVLSGYPPAVAFLEPFNEIIILLGAAAIGTVIYSNNKLA